MKYQTMRSMVCGFSMLIAVSQSQAVSNDELVSGITSELITWTADWLKVRDDIVLDASLRVEIDDIKREHIARMQGMFKKWVVAEQAELADKATSELLVRRLWGRVMNEIALWRLQSPGTDYDDVMAESIAKQGICRLIDGYANFSEAVIRLQAMSSDKRKIALLGERALLARWGSPRADLPPRPEKTLQALEAEVVAKLKADSTTKAPTMPPVLARNLFSDKERNDKLASSCALHQWGFALATAQRGGNRASALSAYRYAMMPMAADWLAYPAVNPGQPSDYPPLAATYEVQGSVVLQLRIDSEGQFKGATVVDRRLTVPGLHGARPVAFETSLDEATIVLAAKATYSKPDPSQLSNGVMTARREYAWVMK
jgi:hypothetical protein